MDVPSLMIVYSGPAHSMPWEIPSLFLRFRSQPNDHAVGTSPPATSPNNNSVIFYDSECLPGVSSEESQLGQKILKDPDSYIDSGTHTDAPHSLAPPPRRRSAGGSGAAPRKSRCSQHISEQIPEMDPRKPAYMQSSVQSEMKAPPSKLGGEREWSTFGRKRERERGNVFDLLGHTPQSSRTTSRSSSSRRRSVQGIGDPAAPGASQHDVAVGSENAMSLSQSSIASVRSYSPSTKSMRKSRGSRSTSRNSSPTDTVSSRRRPRTDHTAAATLPTEMRFKTPVTGQLSFDSPRTFGYPTPHDHCCCSSAAPPLPPLDHPELAVALLARIRAANTKQPVLSIPSKQLFQQEDPVSLMPPPFGISLRNRTSLPGIRQTSESQVSEQPLEPQPPPERRRTRTVSGRPRNQRRTSAEWSAEQAVSGVTSNTNHAWPAEVSREILRLSLGEGMDTRNDKRSGAELLSGSLAKDKSQTRGQHMYQFPHRAPIPPSFSLLPSSPQERVPSPLKGPVTLSAGRAATTRFKSSTLSLYRHSFGDFSDSVAPKMAEVKRSLSAVETRHSPRRETLATYQPSSLGRSASALQTPARIQSLHPYSTISPSRAILYSPSTPTIGGASRPADEVPTTPTPAPKYLSDKSKGKRKADDIDTTPPDQKKEGQRATFVIPSETRSQRISNSSHAPSSYHRKRARLSTTSPFATPSPSRPPSIQEQIASSSKHLAWPSGTSSRGASPRTPSRAASTHSQRPDQQLPYSHRKSHDRHQSMSQVSIPISALVSPHAPSIATSTKFHMRDPRKPPKKLQDTEWGLHFATEDEPGSPLQAWIFFIGFILFPLWWIAALCIPIPKTRTAGDASLEKAVTIIDDPQIEHDAKSWRSRCRVMAVISMFTYIPFIVLVAIFVHR